MDQDKICVCAKNIVNKKICKMYSQTWDMHICMRQKNSPQSSAPYPFMECVPPSMRQVVVSPALPPLLYLQIRQEVSPFNHTILRLVTQK